MTRVVLVVAAHPDDELLGCGGTLAKHLSAGDSVYTLILATGSTSRESSALGGVAALQDAARRAASALGAQAPEFAGFPDNAMDTVPRLDVIMAVERMREKVRPDVVYTHYIHDLNIDHRIAHEAVITAFRPLPGAKPVSIYAYETLSSTEWGATGYGQGFRPNVFVNISNYLSRKLDALAFYNTEMRDPPHPRSFDGVQALARLRGMTVGIDLAEAFEAIRLMD